MATVIQTFTTVEPSPKHGCQAEIGPEGDVCFRRATIGIKSVTLRGELETATTGYSYACGWNHLSKRLKRLFPHLQFQEEES